MTIRRLVPSVSDAGSVAHRGRPALPGSSGRVLTLPQRNAIRDAMRLFVEDDFARGVSPLRRLRCDACGRWRGAPGFVRYQQWDVCHACATRFETDRVRGVLRTIDQFMRVRGRRARVS